MLRLAKCTILLLVSVLVLVGCTTVTIDTPMEGEIFVDPPDIRISFSNRIPKDLQVTLNTKDITSLFDLTTTGGVASGAAVEKYLVPGKNLLVVVEPNKSQIIFYYDVEGPSVHILDVEEGGSTVQVSGYLDDLGGAASLTVNGQSVPLDGNNFSTTIAKEPVVEFVTTDNFGHTSSTSFASRDLDYSPCIFARLTQSAFDILLNDLEEAIGPNDWGPLIRAQNPIYYANYGFFDIYANAGKFQFGQPVIEMEILDDEKFEVRVSVPNIAMGASMGGKIGIVPMIPVDGTVIVDNMEFKTTIQYSITEGDMDIILSNTVIDLNGFYLDLSFLPTWGIESYMNLILNGMIKSIEESFVDKLEGALIPTISEWLKDVTIEGDITNQQGETIHAKALPYYYDNFNGGMTLGLGGTIVAEVADPPGPALGSHYVGGTLPDPSAVTTPSGLEYNMSALFTSNYINQALLAAHESGFTTIQMDVNDNGGISFEGVEIFAGDEDEVTSGDEFRFTISPASPAFLDFLGYGGAAMLRMGIYDMSFSLEMKKTTWNDFREVFHATLNVEVPVELGVTEDHNLHVGVEQLPTIEVTEFKIIGLIKLRPEFLNNVIDHFVPLVLPDIAATVSSVPVPRIGGFTLLPVEFWVDTSYLGMAGNLIKYEVTEAAPEPETHASLGKYQWPDSNAVVADSATTDEANDVTVENDNVAVNVSGDNPSVGELEYRYRVDNGRWSVWKDRSNILLERLLGGHHKVEVCSRTEFLKEDSECAVVEFDTTREP